MKKVIFSSIAVAAIALAVFSFVNLEVATSANMSNACIYGKCVRSDGSKVDGTVKISTSWNNKKAYPKNGKYELCLGSNPGKTITIFVDGNTYKRLYVDGDTKLDITVR